VGKAGQKFVIGNLLILAAGAGIGWLYGHADLGLLIAALIALGWQTRRLLQFDTALRSNDFEHIRYAGGFWSNIYAQFNRLRQRAKSNKKRYRQLLKEVRKSTNAMPDGAVILNTNYEIVNCNQAAKNLAGFLPRQDKGQRIDNILRDPAFSEYLKSEKFNRSIQIRSPLHDDNWLGCRIVPYGAEQRLLLIQDVTERQRLARLRREFVANASHELRSPLTVISGYLDTLVSDPDASADWARPLNQMQIQALRMNKIVGELLELSRLENAGAAPTDEIVDVSGLLSAAKKSFAGREGIPDIRVAVRSTAQLRGSTAEIETIILNLLSNAVRHTDEGGNITMCWSSNADGATLTVEDTGIGIEPEHIPRLTERFFRVDTGRSRDKGGVGLGLAIVKHALERHGAWLDIRSTPGVGSEFICHFPPNRVAVPEPESISGDRKTA
jgi:two-component system phosphate regulon sensor histidine kinase PhoR